MRAAPGDAPLLEGVRGALEQSLLALAERRDLADLTAALREAVATVSRFLEADADDDAALEALEAAASTLTAAGARLTGDEATARRLDSASSLLADALGRLHRRARAGFAPARRADEILASLGVPRAHHVEVPAPRLLARDERGRAETYASLRAGELPAGDLAQVRAIARDCFEDLGSLGSLRRLHDFEPWVDARGFEQRLLDNLDALIALERPVAPGTPPLGLVEALFAYATEWIVPDYGRTFALAFTLCCLASETALRWVVLALRRSHPRTHPAFVDAFALGSSPGLDAALVELGADDDPAIVAVALQAMARRGRPDLATAVLILMRPAPDLVAAATDLAARLPAAAAVPLLSRVLDGVDPVAAAHAGAALASLGEARGAAHLRALLQGPHPAPEAAQRVAFETLCLLGQPGDAALVAAAAGADADRLAWLGWHGHADHVPLLLAALRRAFLAAEEGETYEPVERLARALDRLGGGAAPRPNGFGLTDLDERLAAWSQGFEERRPLEAARLRGGRSWTPVAIVDELSAPATRQQDRPLLARELALITRRAAHLDVTGWVAAQGQQLAAARELVERLPLGA